MAGRERRAQRSKHGARLCRYHHRECRAHAPVWRTGNCMARRRPMSELLCQPLGRHQRVSPPSAGQLHPRQPSPNVLFCVIENDELEPSVHGDSLLAQQRKNLSDGGYIFICKGNVWHVASDGTLREIHLAWLVIDQQAWNRRVSLAQEELLQG